MRRTLVLALVGLVLLAAVYVSARRDNANMERQVRPPAERSYP